jgi:signal transduction histidine kinase/streptogramin lyase
MPSPANVDDLRRIQWARLLPSIVLVAFIAAGRVLAQDLPFVTYTTVDGLPHDGVNRVLQDTRGYLWIAGQTALTRFDGESFTSYGRAEGLDVATGINDLRLGAAGELWIATNGAGIFRFDLTSADPARRFTQFRIGEARASNRVNVVLIGVDGRIWAGTDAGLFIGDAKQGFQRVDLPLPEGEDHDGIFVSSLAADQSSVWVGTDSGAYRCPLVPAGCTGGPRGRINAVLLDHDSRLWTGTDDGIQIWRLDAGGGTADSPVRIGTGWRITRLVLSSNAVLTGTDDGQVIAVDGGTARLLFRSAEIPRTSDIFEDAAGTLWVGTSRGLTAVRRQGITLFSAQHGLRQPVLRSLRRDPNRKVYVATADNWLHRVEGDRLTSVRLALPPGVRRSSWASAAIHIDSDGDVWLGTADGLFRYTKVEFSAVDPVTVAPSARYTVANGLAGDHISELYEDSTGDFWIASLPGSAETLTIRRRESGRFERLGAAHGLPAFNQPAAFVEDGRGAVWARLREGGVVRIRANRATVFTTEHGFPPLVIASLADRSGHLWFGGPDGLFRVTDSSAGPVRITTIPSDPVPSVVALAQDRSGQIFVGTHDGLMAVDPVTSTVRRFSSFDGLPPGSVSAIVEAADGALLLLAGRSLARLLPSAGLHPRAPPNCLVTAVRIGGRSLPLPDWGLEQLEAIDVEPARNQIEIEFVGLSQRLEPLGYEYRLPTVSEQWTRASGRRVTYAGLAAGRYRFEVRATGSGSESASPVATIAFRVLPQWYRRWWFLTAVATSALLGAYFAHRARLAQALRTERLRSRIATDLHDDIGSSLSQIAILAEVARRRAGTSAPAVVEPLASIAVTSRDLVDAMSDIVWAVNPRTDSLSDLTRRMHRFAEETLGAAEIALTFSAPPAEVDLKLGADLRRELYLILKESVNNIARHSRASAATVELKLVRNELRLTIADNGRGFDPAVRTDGNGILSMRKRAGAFGGAFAIDSAPGRGTRVTLRAQIQSY